MENNKIEQFVIKFDYNIKFLQDEVKKVNEIDLTNLDLVKEKYKEFVKFRTTIKKEEKVMVDSANTYRKEVFKKRDEYLEITVPVEEKLKGILDKEQERLELEVRKEMLPTRKKQLSVLVKIEQPTDEEILAMDNGDWLEFYNDKIDENESLIQDEKNKKELEEQHQKDIKEAQEKAKQDTINSIAEERKEKEIKKQIEKTKLEADKKYQDWLKANGYTEETKNEFVIEHSLDGSIKLLKVIAIYNK